jgi:hypothetical protein
MSHELQTFATILSPPTRMVRLTHVTVEKASMAPRQGRCSQMQDDREGAFSAKSVCLKPAESQDINKG